MFLILLVSLHFSHILQQYGRSAKQADEGGPLLKKGSRKCEGRASQPPQMVGETTLLKLIANIFCYIPIKFFFFKLANRQVYLGKDPVSEHTRRQIMEEREIALHEYMVRFFPSV